jgi:predicted RNase H-like nuclease (RuvC/YqgF family)
MKIPRKPFAPNKPYKFYKIEEELSFAWEQELTLNQILKAIPKNVKKQDIKFKVIRVGEGDDAKFYLKIFYSGRSPNKHYQAQLKEYKTNLSLYQKELEKYQRDLDKYDAKFLALQIQNKKDEIKKLQSELKCLRVRTA